jgi:hypothetical protein
MSEELKYIKQFAKQMMLFTTKDPPLELVATYVFSHCTELQAWVVDNRKASFNDVAGIDLIDAVKALCTAYGHGIKWRGQEG